jgi:DHA1 family multidrug resistance protein-like MFS transporter
MIFWKKNLIFIWICQFLAMVGMSAVVPFLPLFIRELGVTELKNTAMWSGFVFAGPFFISFFLAPVWGSLGDKYGRKIMTLRAVFGLTIAQIIIGFSQNVTHLFIGRLIQGALSGFLPAAMALVASNTPDNKTGYALGLLQSATAAGTVLGPLIGGVISDFLGYRFVFFSVAGLLFFTGMLLLIFVKEENRVDGNKTYSFIENWKYLLKNRVLRISALMITLTALGFSFVRPIFVLYVETLNVSGRLLPTITGALYSIMGIVSTFSAAWWGKRVETKGVKKNLLIATIITGSMYAMHSAINDPISLIPVRILLGFGFGAMMPLLFTLISNNVSFERKGGVLGVASSFQIFGNMTGPIIGGYAAGVTGLKSSFVFTGLIFLIIASIIFTKLND